MNTKTTNNPTITTTTTTTTPKLTKREIALKNLSKVNRIKQKEKSKGGRPLIRRDAAKSMKIWAKMYLESCESVKDFEKWRKSKPHEALPWAYKAVYGDAGENKAAAAPGQMHVLISILTGKSTTHASIASSVSSSEVASLPSSVSLQSSQLIENMDDNQTEKTENGTYSQDTVFSDFRKPEVR